MVFVWDSVRNRVSFVLISRKVYRVSQLEKFRVDEAFCKRNAELLKTVRTDNFSSLSIPSQLSYQSPGFV